MSGYKLMQLPCGQCIGCRIAKVKAWSLRCLHESSMWDYNCFITLTYSEENLPEKSSLNKKHVQDFMKKLRSKYKGMKGVMDQETNEIKYPIRYFMCGEYGEKLGRPHYHMALFNFDFLDKVLYQKRGQYNIYISENLGKLWTYGFSTIGDVTLESAAYIASYCQKKILGKWSQVHYARIDKETGEMELVQPEYICMSRRPGIARTWYNQYKNDIYPKDYVMENGKLFRPAKYYDKIYDIEYPEKMQKIRKIRLQLCKKNADNSVSERLRVREACASASLKVKKRQFEKG